MFRSLFKLFRTHSGVALVSALLAFFLLSACETTQTKSPKIRVSIASPEWEIEKEMLVHTPLGADPDYVLEFVNKRLVHSEEEDSESDAFNVYMDDMDGDEYPDEMQYKIIQVHMGLHGAAQQDFLLKSNWVYISWLFENSGLVDIVVTKVVPSEEDSVGLQDPEGR